jgi:hypothetical protein
LYLNLLAYADDSENDFDFRFLTVEESKKNNENHFWFKVGDVLGFKEFSDVNEFVFEQINNSLDLKFASRTLFKLFDAVTKAKPINFFLEKDSSLDKVLNIFIRVNSGGTKLSYSDLLLSIASAQWEDMDAREEIIKFVDEVNEIGGGFGIDKDFVLKTCLVLCDFKDIAFKVDNFNHDNMSMIQSSWQRITGSIRNAFYLISSFGFDKSSLPSNNAVIPVAYYLNKMENPENYIKSTYFIEDRKKVMKFLVISLLKRNFSGQPDNLLRPLREVLQSTQQKCFPLDEIIDKQRGTTKNYTFADEEIENLFGYYWGQSYTFSVLAILYPSLNFTHKFHIDHIFPKALMTESKLRKVGVSEESIQFYRDNFNYLANLQLLEGMPNIEKSSQAFKDWLDLTYPVGTPERESYCKTNYIPDDGDFTIYEFESFINRRKQLMTDAFKKFMG